MALQKLTTRIGLACLAIVMAAACVDPGGQNVGETAQQVGSTTLTTDQPSYSPGATITLSWTNMPGNQFDWVAIVTAGSPPNAGFIAWTYVNGVVMGSQPFNGLPVGDYEARAYQNNTYTVLASAAFTVATGGGGGGNATIATDQQLYLAGQPATVTWGGMPGNQFDWIAIATAGTADNAGFVQWTYITSQVAGSHAFANLAPGNYEARAYLDNSYTVLARSTFSVTGATISTDQLLYSNGQDVIVSWAGMPGNAFDFVAINTAGSPANSGFVQWSYINSQTSGSHTFFNLPAGNYEARAYLNNTYTVVATSTFSISSATATVTTDAAAYTTAQTVTVTYAGLSGSSTDWIAISNVGAPDNSVVAWGYAPTPVGGTMQFSNLPVGTYEARAYLNNTFNVAARSPSFVVALTTGSCVSAAQRPVLGSLASGDLVIGATQTENTASLTVPLSQSILFVTMSENEPSPAYGAAVCVLHDVDLVAMKPAGVTCYRSTMGTDSGSGSITVHWTVATFSSGVTVQRGEVDTGVTTTAALTAVDPTQSFVLLGGMFNAGSGWGNNEFVRAELTSGTTLDIRAASAGTDVSWQVVTMVGASVQRGTTSLASGTLQSQVPITTAPSGSLVLASYTTDNPSGIAAASLMMQSSLMDPNTILFKRDLGGSTLNVAWEVVSLPFATHAGLTTFLAGESSRLESVPGGIVAASSVAITGSQSILGASGGSTSYAGASLDLVGEAAVTLATTTNGVTVARATSQAGAEIPWTVIDFAHDCTGL